MNVATCVPTATSAAETPMQRGEQPAGDSIDCCHSVHRVRPCRHSSTRRLEASNAGRGGSP